MVASTFFWGDVIREGWAAKSSTVWYAQREERELEKVREAEQRRATKELLAAQRQEEELRLKRNLEERKREKDEEARARERIRIKLGVFPPFIRLLCTVAHRACHWVMLWGSFAVHVQAGTVPHSLNKDSTFILFVQCSPSARVLRSFLGRPCNSPVCIARLDYAVG